MLTNNQKRVLKHFQRTGRLTLRELRKASPYWNQAIKALRQKGFVERNLRDDGYVLTPAGGGMISFILHEEEDAVNNSSCHSVPLD